MTSYRRHALMKLCAGDWASAAACPKNRRNDEFGEAEETAIRTELYPSRSLSQAYLHVFLTYEMTDDPWLNKCAHVLYILLTLSLPSSKSTFSQPFKEKCISEVERIVTIFIFQFE